MTDLRIVIVMVVKMGIIVREMGMVLLEIRGQGQGYFRGTFYGKGRKR